MELPLGVLDLVMPGLHTLSYQYTASFPLSTVNCNAVSYTHQMCLRDRVQEHLERAAYKLGGGNAPCTLKKNFLDGTVPSSFGRVKTTVLPGAAFCLSLIHILCMPDKAALSARH